MTIVASLAAIGDIGTLPRPGLGIAVVAGARSKKNRVAFRLTRWAEQRRYVRTMPSGRGGLFDYLSGSLDVCRQLWRSGVPGGLCVVGGLARLDALGIVDTPKTQAHIMATAGGALYLERRIAGVFHVRLQAELVGQLLRPRYTALVTDPDNDRLLVERLVHHPAPLAGRLGASWGLSF